MHFKSTNRVEPRSSLTISFELRLGLNLCVRGRAIATISDPANKVHHHRTVFDALPDHVRDSIIQHVNAAWRVSLIQQSLHQ